MLQSVALACRRQKYDSIQLMRAVAVISVIFNHIPMIGSGAFGVDLFFCISGFIMMFITGQGSAQFLERRALRIVPLYWLATFALIGAMQVAPRYFPDTSLSVSHVIKSLFFIPYADGNGVPLLYPGWTLTGEMFFYLIFFVSLKISHQYRHFIAGGILVAVVAISAMLQHAIPPEFVILWGHGNAILLEFVLGMVVYKLLMRRRPDENAPRKASVLLLLGAICLWMSFWAGDYFGVSGKIERVIRWGIPMSLLFMLLFRYFENRRVPVALVFLGNISYSIYLTHVFVINLFSGRLNVLSPGGILLVFGVVIPLCFLLAFASWFLIENKLASYLRKALKI